MLLTIIIPYYNLKQYTDELLDCLDKQITPEVEVILIDDGSKEPYKTKYEWCQVIRQKNQGVSVARNKGISKAAGQYITFIDADDMVSDVYIDKLLTAIKKDPDVIEYSWKSYTLNGSQFNVKLNSDTDRLRNPSACTRTFKRSIIGDIRFNVKKDAAEDEEFSRKVGYIYTDTDLKIAVIPDYLYYYRTDVDNSQTKRYARGMMRTKRIIYHYEQVTQDMTFLLEQIKKDDEQYEVILLTNKCDISELRRYCQILKPHKTWCNYFKGEPYKDIELIAPPIETQVVLYRKQVQKCSGITTFIFDYVDMLKDLYDIALVTQNIDDRQQANIATHIRVITSKQAVECDTLVMLSILDDIPENIKAKKIIRMVHTCNTDPNYKIKDDCDDVVFVSEAAKESFKGKGTVINNPIAADRKKSLLLISASRIPASDKGDCEKRMRILANKLRTAQIPYIWLNFSDGKISDMPEGFYNMGFNENVRSFMKNADYVVQLSDSEAYSYTILEAITVNTPVIVTPFKSTKDMNIEDGVNGYIVPYDMDFDVNILLDIPRFKYTYDQEDIVNKWRDILGNTKPKGDYKIYREKFRTVRVLKSYIDIELNRELNTGDMIQMHNDRINYLKIKGLVEET